MKSMAETTPLLAVRDLAIRFADSPAWTVHGIDFEIGRGEIVALVGESGSGKSASAMSLLGLLPGDTEVRGHANFDGTDLLATEGAARRAWLGRRIALVFQDPAAALDPVFCIGAQLDETLRLRHPELSGGARRQRAIELLDSVGIAEAATRLKAFPHQMSGGQLQRVMIALALAGEPELLIADEPTTALDVTVQQEILDLIWRLNRDRQMAVLLITHDMGVVADLAQRVIVMRQGRIVENAPAAQLFHAPAAAYTRELLAALPGRNAAQAAPPIADTPLLTVDALHVGYASGWGRRTDVVHGVSFALHAGQFLGLVGESGSGKSTIGRSLLGLIAPSSGRVVFDGHDLGTRSPGSTPALRARIGAVFQSPANSLNPRMTLDEAIAEPLRAHRQLDKAQLRRRVDQLLDQVRLPAAWRNRLTVELSGGQRQRVAIARAIALDPLLLVADEPTSSLDVSIQASILDLLRELQRENGFACLFISHDLSVVRELCRQVVVLRRGEVVEAGPTPEILDQPRQAYTRKLVASALWPDPERQRKRRLLRMATPAQHNEFALTD